MKSLGNPNTFKLTNHETSSYHGNKTSIKTRNIPGSVLVFKNFTFSKKASFLLKMIGIVMIFTACLAVPSLSAPSNPVFTLTDQNFDQFLQDKAVMLVDFFAPWCSDCANLEPHFDMAAKQLAKEKKFVLAKMDCFGEGRYTCARRFGIHQWPTLKVFRYGNYAGDYQGSQDEGSIKSYVEEALNDSQQQNDQRAPNGLWNQSQQQYGNGCSQGGWSFTQVSPESC